MAKVIINSTNNFCSTIIKLDKDDVLIYNGTNASIGTKIDCNNTNFQILVTKE